MFVSFEWTVKPKAFIRRLSSEAEKSVWFKRSSVAEMGSGGSSRVCASEGRFWCAGGLSSYEVVCSIWILPSAVLREGVAFRKDSVTTQIPAYQLCSIIVSEDSTHTRRGLRIAFRDWFELGSRRSISAEKLRIRICCHSD